MSATGTAYVNAVIDALRLITRANGYNTNAGTTVKRGRPEQLIADQIVEFPALLVSTEASEILEAKPGAAKKERRVSIDAVVNATVDDYEPMLDEIDEDVTRALLTLVKPAGISGSAIAVSISGGDYQHPDAGGSFAIVRFMITQMHVVRV